MGCFTSRKTFIEEKIEECENYLGIQVKNIIKIKEAFFQLNDGDIIKENALGRAIKNLNIVYSTTLITHVVLPFYKSFSIEINEEEEKENGPKKSEMVSKLDELMKKNVNSGIFDFNQIICVLYLLSNEKGSTKASELFKYYCGLSYNKMSKNQFEEFFNFLFQAVAFYSLVFSEISPKKITLLSSKLEENVKIQ